MNYKNIFVTESAFFTTLGILFHIICHFKHLNKTKIIRTVTLHDKKVYKTLLVPINNMTRHLAN